MKELTRECNCYEVSYKSCATEIYRQQFRTFCNGDYKELMNGKCQQKKAFL